MAAPRLTFLYPNFFRSIRSCEPHASRPLRDAPHHRTAQKAGFHSTARKRQETYAQRYGPASDLPPPHLGDAKVTTSKDITKDPKPSAPIKAEKKTEPAEPKPEVKKIEKEAKREANATSDGRSSPKDITKRPAELDAGESHPKELAHDGPPREGASKPLETVLYIEPATSTNSEEHRPPHLHAPPYVHHFDTYTLVKDLEKGGFTQDQSVTLMKAVRSLLALNLDVAKEGLVSKSDVENETYLFRAACSELRTEIQNNRQSTSDQLRTERAQLQHEVDILNQKLTQELLTLKDDLKGMFNDRKMAVRMEQRALESSIQELNYKITVALNSDSKSEVEGLRWVLTRRAVLAIVSMAFLILSSLRYSSYQLHAREQAKKLSSSSSSSSTGSGGSFTVPSREAGTQTGESAEMLANLNSGSSPSYVSLG